jgi:hypothetical protein
VIPQAIGKVNAGEAGGAGGPASPAFIAGRVNFAPFPSFARRGVLDVRQQYASGPRFRKATKNPSKFPPAAKEVIAASPAKPHLVRSPTLLNQAREVNLCEAKRK